MNNSRIVNELIEKANEWSYEEYNYKETGYTREQLYSQKLAELIVKQCANIVRNSSLPDSYSEACLRNIADELEEHFGVEP